MNLFHIPSPILNFGAVKRHRIILFKSEVPCTKVAKRCADLCQLDKGRPVGGEIPTSHTCNPPSWWDTAWDKDLTVFTSHTQFCLSGEVLRHLPSRDAGRQLTGTFTGGTLFIKVLRCSRVQWKDIRLQLEVKLRLWFPGESKVERQRLQRLRSQTVRSERVIHRVEAGLGGGWKEA